MSLSARFTCVSRVIVLYFLLFHAVLFLLKLNARNSFDICSCRCDPFCRLDKFALLQYLLSFIFVNVISVFQLISQEFYIFWNESITVLFIAFALTLCNCLCSSSCFSANAIQNIGEFRAKSCFTDHQRANTINGFINSVPVL